ncbi:MAG TPA: serpin family protein, partial [Puia sp.]
MKLRLLYCILPGLMAFLPVPHNDSPRHLLHPEFAQSHDQFAFRLLQTVVQQDPVRNNKVISPLSLYLTLAMLYNGAAHETKDSIAGALRAEDIQLPNFNSFCKEAMQQMPLEDERVDFTLTSAIWYNRRKLTLLPAYEEMMQNFYYTPIQPLNFGSRDATTHINQWVSENTRHEINNIAGKVNPNDAMVVVNALYFKAPWVRPFQTGGTTTAEFRLLDLPARMTRFMNEKTILNTFSDTAFTMVELPCGAGKNYSLYVVLPVDATRPVEDWVTCLNPEKLNYALDRMTPQFLDFYLPR